MARITTEAIEKAYRGSLRYIFLSRSRRFVVKSHTAVPPVVLDKISQIFSELDEKMDKGQ
jgi:hypothetical protein